MVKFGAGDEPKYIDQKTAEDIMLRLRLRQVGLRPKSVKSPFKGPGEFFYHGTLEKHIPGIQRTGLQPLHDNERCNWTSKVKDCAGKLFLSSYASQAQIWGWLARKFDPEHSKMVLLRVPTAKVPDAQPLGDTDYFVTRVIPSEDIEALINGTWRPIQEA